MANREEGAAVPNQRQGQEQPYYQNAVRQKHIHLNWSNFKPEFSGKLEEDEEVHLLQSNDWMEAHHFEEDTKGTEILSHIARRSMIVVSVLTTVRKHNMVTITKFI